MDKNNIYKNIPSVNILLENKFLKEISLSRKVKLRIIRKYLDEVRKKISENIPISNQQMVEDLVLKLSHETRFSIGRVINATGIVLHTGLGRAPIPSCVADDLQLAIKGYLNLEVDSNSGERSHRDIHIAEIIKTLTNAEGASVVNNNAGAVLIVLATLAKNKTIVVSAGELVEIGGSFRIPDIIEQCGARLKIVGCTNKTHISDYENAINQDTAVILHVHTSNYKINGFTHTPTLQELSSLAQKHKLPLVYDAGSGALINLSQWGLPREPLIQDAISGGVDIVTFSGDKLLGGGQAGIIVGKQLLIEKIRKNHLFRALRPDKMTLFVLERVLKLYLNPESLIKNNPTISMLTKTAESTKAACRKIYDEIKENTTCNTEIVYFPSYTGSGALPTVDIPSYALALQVKKSSTSISEIAQRLRNSDPPIFTALKNNTLYIATRTLFEDDFEYLVSALKKIL